MDYSLTFKDIENLVRSLNPSCKFIVKPYSYIENFNTVESLMRNLDAIIILYQTSMDYGHYVCLTKCNTQIYRDYIKSHFGVSTDKPIYCFFDPYGYLVDQELKFVPARLKGILGEEFPRLRTMLNNSSSVVEWSDYHLQGAKSSTCGRWTAMRSAEYMIPLEEWVTKFKVKNPDKLIVEMTSRGQKEAYLPFGVRGGAKKTSVEVITGTDPLDLKKKRSRVKIDKSKGPQKSGTVVRKRRAPKVQYGTNGNVVQNVNIDIGDSSKPRKYKKAREEVDERFSFKDIYAAPPPRHAVPIMTRPPTQANLALKQQVLYSMDPNALNESAMRTAGAMNQLSNNMGLYTEGIRRAMAENHQELLFQRQASTIGGANPPGPVYQIIPPAGSRQLRLDASRRGIPTSIPTRAVDPAIDPTLGAQLVAQDDRIDASNRGIPISNNTVPTITVSPDPRVSILQDGPPRGVDAAAQVDEGDVVEPTPEISVDRAYGLPLIRPERVPRHYDMEHMPQTRILANYNTRSEIEILPTPSPTRSVSESRTVSRIRNRIIPLIINQGAEHEIVDPETRRLARRYPASGVVNQRFVGSEMVNPEIRRLPTRYPASGEWELPEKESLINKAMPRLESFSDWMLRPKSVYYDDLVKMYESEGYDQYSKLYADISTRIAKNQKTLAPAKYTKELFELVRRKFGEQNPHMRLFDPTTQRGQARGRD